MNRKIPEKHKGSATQTNQDHREMTMAHQKIIGEEMPAVATEKMHLSKTAAKNLSWGVPVHCPNLRQ